MTSEVVVMNRIGVALAADSAVTLDMGNNSKVRDSALKLFMLSKYRPVGVMVYNNAQILGVPLEAIIKLFRHDLGRRGFDTLREYGNELIRFLDGNTTLFPDALQTRYFLKALEAELHRIDKQVGKKLVEQALFGEDSINMAKTAEEVTAKQLKLWEQKEDAKDFGKSAKAVVGRHSGEVNKAINSAAANWDVKSRSTVENLYKIAKHLVGKVDVFSGLVIAGFGEAEHFPALMKFEIGGVYGNQLKVCRHLLAQVTDEKPSEVMAFADTKAVDAFLYGVAPEVFSHLEDAKAFIRELPPLALDAVTGLSPKARSRATDAIRKASRKQAEKFVRKVLQGAGDRYQKIAHAAETLTIGELAQVASTLVGLSSFEQQLSLERQTVGGPVDVAVISKGDGFVWINRKHYFRRDLNDHFFRKYYDDAPEADDADDDEKEVKDGE